jgi:hypothetical protein
MILSMATEQAERIEDISAVRNSGARKLTKILNTPAWLIYKAGISADQVSSASVKIHTTGTKILETQNRYKIKNKKIRAFGIGLIALGMLGDALDGKVARFHLNDITDTKIKEKAERWGGSYDPYCDGKREAEQAKEQRKTAITLGNEYGSKISQIKCAIQRYPSWAKAVAGSYGVNVVEAYSKWYDPRNLGVSVGRMVPNWLVTLFPEYKIPYIPVVKDIPLQSLLDTCTVVMTFYVTAERLAQIPIAKKKTEMSQKEIEHAAIRTQTIEYSCMKNFQAAFNDEPIPDEPIRLDDYRQTENDYQLAS